MNELVVDTSVAFKWFCQIGEPGVPKAFALLETSAEGDLVLHAPASLTWELANALRFSQLPQTLALSAVEYLGLAHVELHEVTPERLLTATSLAYRHGIAVYDALFLQLAEERECPLVTSDRKAFAGIDTPIEVRLL